MLDWKSFKCLLSLNVTDKQIYGSRTLYFPECLYLPYFLLFQFNFLYGMLV